MNTYLFAPTHPPLTVVKMPFYRKLVSSLLLLFVTLIPLTAFSQLLVFDDFGGSGLVNQDIWRLPFSGDGAFLGRTELRSDRATDYPSVANGTVRLQLDTFRNNGAGQSTGLFFGSELQTKRNFVVGGGLSLQIRCRLINPVGGLVGGLFLFDVQRNNQSGVLVRDEIDFELLSNATDEVLTNFWNEGTFFGADASGTPALHFPSGNFDITDFQDYRIEWFPDRIDWFVNNEFLRSQQTDVPDDPMNFRLNLWAPDPGFSNAFNANLQPANNAGQNANFEFEVDSVVIAQLNTERSSNLLVNSSFEDLANPPINLNSGGNQDTSSTGQWFSFNNIFLSSVTANSGSQSILSFGPFTGNSDASGIFQNVDAVEGDVFEASVFGRTNSNDSIDGQENFAAVRIEFLDAQGNLIPGVEEFLGANGKESIILEGRDPDTIENEWVPRQVNAVAPPGTVRARTSVNFVQLANGPGAVFLDDVELVRLSPISFILGDVNQDGDVNLLDVGPFVDLLSNGGFLPEADINGDDTVDLLDVAPFVDLLSG